MAQVYPSISDELKAFIEAQHMFFVATAPLSGDGHINLSPKGMDTFRVLGSNRVAYLDMTGSGNETAAHLQENGRITFMFCAFERKPVILRLYGRARSVQSDSPDWPDLSQHFTILPGTRQIFVADITRVQTSCGFGVPVMTHIADRDTLIRKGEVRCPQATRQYWNERNHTSIDGMPTWCRDID